MFISQCKCLELRHVSIFLIQIYENLCLDNLLVRQLKHRSFIYNALNCLNEENKKFSNSLYLIFFSSSLTLCLYLNVKQLKPTLLKSTKNCDIGVLDVSHLVRQLKTNGFICNALNCLNEENIKDFQFLQLRHVPMFLNTNI
jgi:hypothetical protein